jgi:hypothetical protein
LKGYISSEECRKLYKVSESSIPIEKIQESSKRESRMGQKIKDGSINVKIKKTVG